MRGPLYAHERARPLRDDPSEEERWQDARRHGAQADPTSGFWLTAADRRTSQLGSQIRCILIVRDKSVYARGNG